MDCSADPRVVAIRSDRIINDENGTGTVLECFSDADLVAELDDVDCRRSWADAPDPITTVAKAVAYFRRLERLKKAQWSEWDNASNW